MFVGLIRETGKVMKKYIGDRDGSIAVKMNVYEDVKEGDSISVDGACLSVREILQDGYLFYVSSETLLRSIVRFYSLGDVVNIELPARMSDKIEGHIVLGHVDFIARVLDIKKMGEGYFFSFVYEGDYDSYIIDKDSIAINGISLTITDVKGNIFSVAIIPQTYNTTNLCYIKKGDYVNVELNILTKAVVKNITTILKREDIWKRFLQSR